MNELPCDTEPTDVEIPQEVTEAAARLFQLYCEGSTEPVPAGAEEIIREIRTRPVNVQPQLPKLFQQIIANQNARAAIRALGSEMTQAQWRQLKELSLDMKKSLRPGAEMFLKQARSDEWHN